MCLLSIIIPNYNNEKYIKRCLDSILCSDSKEFEVIVVDDGSSDGSVKVLQSYEDKRLKYYTQVNQGVSAARNKGISHAKGFYITFCDSDDYYIENAVDNLVDAINQENKAPDIFVFNAFKEYIGKNGCRGRVVWPNAIFERVSSTAPQPIDCRVYMEFVVQNSNMNSAVNKVYKNTLLNANKVSFPIGLGIGEDGIFNLRCAAHSAKIMYLPSQYYVYCYGESEFTSGKLRCKTGRLDEMLRGIFERERIIDEYTLEHGISENDRMKLRRLHRDYIIEQLFHQIKGVKNNVERTEFKKYIKGNADLKQIINYMLFRGTSLKRRIQSIAVFAMIRI